MFSFLPKTYYYKFCIMKEKIDICLLTSRRPELFKETIDSLFKSNPDLILYINNIYILDDRSTLEDREMMVNFVSSYTLKNPTMICFNSDEPFDWVDKYNFIGKIVDTKFVFILEDDWKCIKPINFDFLINKMSSDKITQIALCDPLWIQHENLINKYQNDDFWENPWPNDFRHITHKSDNFWVWITVRMRHYTNNPSITLTSILKESPFVKNKSFEHLFADSQNLPFQLFSKELHFEHIGNENSLTNPKNI